MPKYLKDKLNGIGNGIKYFFMSLLQMQSTRIQLVWGTFFAWAFSMFHFGFLIPLLREISIIFYRQNGINSSPVNFDSPHAVTILGMTGAAFLSVVVSYVTSTYLDRKNSGINTTKLEIDKQKGNEG